MLADTRQRAHYLGRRGRTGVRHDIVQRQHASHVAFSIDHREPSDLMPHPWAEPIERLLAAAEPAGVRVAVPKPGERVDPAAATESDAWWRLTDQS